MVWTESLVSDAIKIVLVLNENRKGSGHLLMENSHMYNIANKNMQNPDDKSRSLREWDQSQKCRMDTLDRETPARMQNDSWTGSS